MSWSFKLFKIKGIDVKIHTLFILILVWAAYRWSVTTGDGLQGALFGVVATLLLFVAVFLHELGHSLQAMKYKVKVKDITLMPLGGVAQMEELPKNPEQELKIALAGPLVNFAIAAILVVIGMILQTRSIISLNELVSSFGQTTWAGMLTYLTMANLLLALFNLLPAFPMDGGRILRSLLAMRIDHTRATRIAAVIGQGLAFLMGLVGFMSGQFTLILIAIFVWIGASQESRGVVVQDTLREIKVRRAMVRSPHSLKGDDSLSNYIILRKIRVKKIAKEKLKILNIELKKQVDQRTLELNTVSSKYASTLENIFEGCQILDKNWNYLYLNDSAALHNRRPNEECIGKRFMDVWPGTEKTDVFIKIKQCLEDGSRFRIENKYIFPNGSEGHFILNIQPIPEGVLILSDDITERKLNELQIQHLNRLYDTRNRINQSIVRVNHQNELFETI